MDKHFQTIVIGLGAMGSAAAFQLAKRGNRMLGIDQYSPPHVYGSSHGDTRITRQAIGEGAEYVPLVLRSYEIWDEIQRETGNKILTVTGGLIMTGVEGVTRHGSQFFNQTVACAEKYGIAHRILDADEIRRQFPQFKLSGEERGYFEENAGYLRPELAVETQLGLAQRYGAQLALDEKVLSFSVNPAGRVIVKTDKTEYEAEKAILSAGPWVTQLLGEEYRKYFTIYRQVLYWFDVDVQFSRFEAPDFPVWIWEFGTAVEDLMYGFPSIDGAHEGIKIAFEQYKIPTTPDVVASEVSELQIEAMYKHYVQPHFNGVSDRCVKAVTCLYTVTPDHRFVIDTHPQYPQVIIASPCSGHGFKHSAAVGEVLAQLVTEGRTDIDIRPFSFRRFTEKSK
ncbi:MAG TPA: N-methyl-L-tryptophan oxidase [Anaerolineales bacterium]|nr:N-methyl-L-tryptophan oxidase [Anaerolineales bacterium]